MHLFRFFYQHRGYSFSVLSHTVLQQYHLDQEVLSFLVLQLPVSVVEHEAEMFVVARVGVLTYGHLRIHTCYSSSIDLIYCTTSHCPERYIMEAKSSLGWTGRQANLASRSSTNFSSFSEWKLSVLREVGVCMFKKCGHTSCSCVRKLWGFALIH